MIVGELLVRQTPRLTSNFTAFCPPISPTTRRTNIALRAAYPAPRNHLTLRFPLQARPGSNRSRTRRLFFSLTLLPNGRGSFALPRHRFSSRSQKGPGFRPIFCRLHPREHCHRINCKVPREVRTSQASFNDSTRAGEFWESLYSSSLGEFWSNSGRPRGHSSSPLPPGQGKRAIVRPWNLDRVILSRKQKLSAVCIGWGERERDVRDFTKQKIFTIECIRHLGGGAIWLRDNLGLWRHTAVLAQTRRSFRINSFETCNWAAGGFDARIGVYLFCRKFSSNRISVCFAINTRIDIGPVHGVFNVSGK